MSAKNTIRGVIWLFVLALTAGYLFVSFQTHEANYDIAPNQLAIVVEVAVIALLTIFFWYLATNSSEGALRSKVYGFISSHGAVSTLISVMVIHLVASGFFVPFHDVVSKDGYSPFTVPVAFVPVCVYCALAFAIPPVQVSHWSRKSEGLMTLLLTLVRVCVVIGALAGAAAMCWYSF